MESEHSAGKVERRSVPVSISTNDDAPVVLGSSESPSQTPLPASSLIHAAVESALENAEKAPAVIIPELTPFADPFGGFGGHCFFHLCQFVEYMTGWSRSRRTSHQIAAESVLNHHSQLASRNLMAVLLGTSSIAVVAGAVIPLFHSSSVKTFLPFAFLAIIVLVAFWFGHIAGILGTLAAAFLFADFLFDPPGIAVDDPVAKAHLIWMLVLGVALSELLARYKLHRLSGKQSQNLNAIPVDRRK